MGDISQISDIDMEVVVIVDSASEAPTDEFPRTAVSPRIIEKLSLNDIIPAHSSPLRTNAASEALYDGSAANDGFTVLLPYQQHASVVSGLDNTLPMDREHAHDSDPDIHSHCDESTCEHEDGEEFHCSKEGISNLKSFISDIHKTVFSGLKDSPYPASPSVSSTQPPSSKSTFIQSLFRKHSIENGDSEASKQYSHKDNVETRRNRTWSESHKSVLNNNNQLSTRDGSRTPSATPNQLSSPPSNPQSHNHSHQFGFLQSHPHRIENTRDDENHHRNVFHIGAPARDINTPTIISSLSRISRHQPGNIASSRIIGGAYHHQSDDTSPDRVSEYTPLSRLSSTVNASSPQVSVYAVNNDSHQPTSLGHEKRASHDGQQAISNEADLASDIASGSTTPVTQESKEHSRSTVWTLEPAEHETHSLPFRWSKVDRRERSDSIPSIFRALMPSGQRKSTISHLNKRHDDSDGSHSKNITRNSSEVSFYDKYGRPDEIVGKGANSTVRLVHVSTDKDDCYAVKKFRKRRKDETERDYIKKMVAEFCISSSLQHINIVKSIDLIQDDNGKWCEVMDYCPGGDLHNKCSTIGFDSSEEIYCYFRQILEGVNYMHSIGVAHRDLKPENILIDATRRIIKITDFGTAIVFRTQFEKQSHTAHGAVGSNPYIPPEEWDENNEYQPTKVDVWACGIILYAMINKSLLWQKAKLTDEHYSTYINKREAGFPPFEKQLPFIKKILYEIINPDASKRPEVKDVLQDSWVSTIEYCTECQTDHDKLNTVYHSHKTA